MGQANRQRRKMKEKERKRARSSGSAAPGSSGWAPGAAFGPAAFGGSAFGGPAAGAAFGASSGAGGSSEQPGRAWQRDAGPSTQEAIAVVLHAAMHAYLGGNHRAYTNAIDALVEQPDQAGWRSGTLRVLGEHLQSTLTALWKQGWQPVDLARYVGRQFSVQHTRLLADAIVAELSQYAADTIDPRWADQVAELDAKIWWPSHQTYLRAWSELPNSDWVMVVPRAVDLLSLLSSLPKLEVLGPIPGTARPTAGTTARTGPPVDDRVLSRIRALLAKAESTTSEAEAEAFTAGAQERMARHSIDLAMLAAHQKDDTQKPIGRRIGIDNPYEASKVMLLNAVCDANRCKVVWSKAYGFCTVVGFESDLMAVETLFTSLLVQATTAVTRAGARTGAGGRSRTRSFRQSFLIAYASRIGERLSEITGAQTAAASAEPGGGNLLPVLASRTRQVEDTVSDMFPRLTTSAASSANDAEGWYSGRGAADLASLHAGEALAE